MKSAVLRLILSGLILCAWAGAAHAIVTNPATFSPNPADLNDLDHNCYYSWQVNWTVPTGQTIVGATLSISNINNWNRESNILYVHLLNSAPTLATRLSSTVTQGTDGEGGGDAFLNQGILLTTYTDTNGLPGPAENWSYAFTASQVQTLISDLADGTFGLGFDPDCHFYNDGITLSIQTETIHTNPPVPEPATMALVALGLGSAAMLRRRKALRTKV